MAVFEKISRVRLSTISTNVDILDVRFVELPYYRPKKTGFDPREHRNPKVEIKPWMAYFNLMKISFGAGMLGMPKAISQMGIILGPISVISVGLLIMHTHLVLMWCLNEIARQLKITSISYRYGFRIALLHGPPFLHPLGNMGPCIIAIFMFLSQLGVCTLFIIFTADNLRDIMDWESNYPSLLVLFLPYMILEMTMKNLRIISHVVMASNFLNLLALIFTTYVILSDPHGQIELLPYGFISIYFALGTLFFNMTAMGVCLSCEKALKDPKIMTKRWGVIQVGLLCPTIVGTVFGTMGYFCFGLMEENVLRYLPFDSLVSQTAFGIYLITVGLSYPIMCYPGIQIILEVIKNHDPLYEPSNKTLKAVKKVLRPMFVMTSFLLAYLIPLQGPFVAFIGNICTTMLSLVFPALMEIGINYPKYYGPFNYLLIKDVIIIFFGCSCWITGTVLCGRLVYLRMLQMGGNTPFQDE